MGAYLSKPITEKVMTFEESNALAVVSCSMQGWRTSQEDAHNAILDYGQDSSLFAVYDGHGGSEVASYCALHLPEFIKKNSVFTSGDLEKGLVDSFVSFDKSLTNSEVVAELKKLSGDLNDDEDQDEHDPGEVNHLYEEATMPLEHVIAKYQGEISSDVDEPTNGEPLPGPSTSGASTSRAANRTIENLAKRDKIAISPSLRSKTVSKVSEDSKTNGQVGNLEEIAGSSSTKTENVDEKIQQKVEQSISPKKEDSNGNNLSSNVNGVSPTKNGESNGVHEAPVNGDVKTEAEKKSLLVKDGSEIKDESCLSKKRSTSALELYHKVALADPDEDDEDLDDDSDQSFGRSDGEDSNESDEDPEEEDANEIEEEDTEDEEEDDDDDDDDDDDGDIYETSMAGKLNEVPGNDSGCTAVVAVLKGRNLFVANAGDSRCIVSRSGKAVDMSEDHKPEDPIERSRIEKAGGSVTLEGRVNGGLNLSRALGDHAYKKTFTLPHTEQMISPVPDVRHLKIDPETDSFVFLACDGIWNSMSSQEVVDFISKRLNAEESPNKNVLESICRELFEHCLAPDTMGDGTGCDNMTAVLVKLKPGFKNICDEESPTVGVKRSADASTTDILPERPIKKSKPEDENSETISALQE